MNKPLIFGSSSDSVVPVLEEQDACTSPIMSCRFAAIFNEEYISIGAVHTSTQNASRGMQTGTLGITHHKGAGKLANRTITNLMIVSEFIQGSGSS